MNRSEKIDMLNEEIRKLEDEAIQASIAELLPFLQEHATAMFDNKTTFTLQFDNRANEKLAMEMFSRAETTAISLFKNQLLVSTDVFIEMDGNDLRGSIIYSGLTVNALRSAISTLKSIKIKSSLDKLLSGKIVYRNTIQKEIDELYALNLEFKD